jgi:hypothetical protein
MESLNLEHHLDNRYFHNGLNPESQSSPDNPLLNSKRIFSPQQLTYLTSEDVIKEMALDMSAKAENPTQSISYKV